MNKRAVALILSFSICLTAGCSTGSVTETSAETAAETSQETTATTAEPTEETWPEDRYIPFASGNGFSLIEEGYGTEVTDQQYGTCWAHSAATALESNYLLCNGEVIDVDPNDIVYATYGHIGVSDPDRDGFHARIYSMYNVGGGPDQVMAGISNGLDGGYFWISYETGFDEPMGLTGSYDYSYVLSYDGANTAWIEGDGEIRLANVFEYEGTLGAVGTYTSEADQEVTVEIYEGELTDRELIATVTETFEYPGYHTLVLDTPVEVENFTVVAVYDGSAPVEGESQEDYYGDSYIRFAGSSESGQSYILIGGEWTDLASDGIEDLLGTDFLPNNACIKALFL